MRRSISSCLSSFVSPAFTLTGTRGDFDVSGELRPTDASNGGCVIGHMPVRWASSSLWSLSESGSRLMSERSSLYARSTFCLWATDMWPVLDAAMRIVLNKRDKRDQKERKWTQHTTSKQPLPRVVLTWRPGCKTAKRARFARANVAANAAAASSPRHRECEVAFHPPSAVVCSNARLLRAVCSWLLLLLLLLHPDRCK